MPKQLKKICVDSRFRNDLSKSNTDFKVDLAESFHLPDDTAVIITDISIPRSWYSVEYYSENFYFRLVEPDEADPGVTWIQDYRIKLTHCNHTITTIMEDLVNGMNAAVGSLSMFRASADTTTATITIEVAEGKKLYIFSDKDLLNRVNGTWNGDDYDAFRPYSCNAIIGFNDNYDYTKPYTSSNPWVSGVIDVMGIHNIYITCSQFGNNSIGPKGEKNILKKVVVNTPFGGIITENWLNDQDYTDCSKQLIRSLDFRLTDSYGNTLELHGGHVSFTLIFVNV
jgi:hypothetical protein